MKKTILMLIALSVISQANDILDIVDPGHIMTETEEPIIQDEEDEIWIIKPNDGKCFILDKNGASKIVCEVGEGNAKLFF